MPDLFLEYVTQWRRYVDVSDWFPAHTILYNLFSSWNGFKIQEKSSF